MLVSSFFTESFKSFRSQFLVFCLFAVSRISLAQSPEIAEIVAHDSLDYDSISVSIDEVVISGKRPTVSVKDGIMSVRIEGTSLETRGELRDMLTYVPGIILKNDKIEVLGRGTPLYLINGVEMKNEEMVFSLKSEQIKKIEIIKYPSSAYPSGTRAVVNIVTKNKLKDELSVNVASTTSIKRKVSESPSTFISFKKGKWLMNFSYKFSYLQNLNKETYYRDIYSTSRTFHADWQREDFDKDRMHNINYSVNYDMSDKCKFGFTYLFSRDDEDNPITGQNKESSSVGTSIVEDVVERCRNKINSHSMNFNWTGSLSENSTMHFIQDISFYKKNGLTDVIETNVETTSMMHNMTDGQNKSDIYTTNLKYENSDLASMGCSFGLRYDHFRTQMESNVNDLLRTVCRNYNKNQCLENIYSAYAELSKEWTKLEWTAGVRYECLQRSYTDLSGSDVTSERTSSCNKNFFPYLNVEYKPNDDFSLLLNYETELANPSLAMLNSGMTYIDSLTYETGDKNIKSSYTHTLSMEMDWRMLSFGVEYEYTKNYIITPYIQVNDASDIICSSPVNLDGVRELSFSLGFNKTWNKWDISINAYEGLPYSKIVYLGKEKILRKPYTSGTASVTYELSPKIRIYTQFMYQGANETINTIQKGLNSWDIGITGELGRLKYNLSFKDLLHCAHYNNCYDIYQNVEDGTYGTNDCRGLRLSLSYNLFSKKMKINDKISNSNILNRL